MIQSVVQFYDTLNPLLALAIHNGHALPEHLLPFNGLPDETRFREEDPHTGTFARLFPNRMVVETSRFALDLNRSPDRAIYQNPEDAWGLNVRSHPLTDDILQGLQQDYSEWYAVLKYEIERMLSFHPFLVVLDLHSYNHLRGGPDAEPDPQEDNPDIILGRNNMPQEYYPHIDALRALLDGKDFCGKKLDVRCDVKFPGGYLSRWLHNTFPGQLLCLSVEFKKIFMDEWSGKLNPVSTQSLRFSFRSAIDSWFKDLPVIQRH